MAEKYAEGAASSATQLPDLTAITELVLNQPVRGKEALLEWLCSLEVANKYEAKTSDGKLLFEINEESNCLIRQCMHG